MIKISRARAAAFQLLLANPKKQYTSGEISEQTGQKKGSVQHFLVTMVREGLLIREEVFPEYFYQMNPKASSQNAVLLEQMKHGVAAWNKIDAVRATSES